MWAGHRVVPSKASTGGCRRQGGRQVHTVLAKKIGVWVLTNGQQMKNDAGTQLDRRIGSAYQEQKGPAFCASVFELTGLYAALPV